MKIKYEDGNLTISRKTKVDKIHDITITQKSDNKFSVWLSGCNGKFQTITVNKVEFYGIEFKICGKWLNFDSKNWVSNPQINDHFYINYYTLPVTEDKGTNV